MDVDTWNAVVHVAAVVAGVVFGSAAIGTACWVWLKKQTFAYGGSVLCAAGVTLLGLSIWQNLVEPTRLRYILNIGSRLYRL